MSNIEITKYEAEHLLGLTGSYTKQDLNRAYRKKVKEYHPDLVAARGGDPIVSEELMIRVNEAKKYLEGFFEGSETVECSAEPANGETAGRAATSRTNTTDAGGKADEKASWVYERPEETVWERTSRETAEANARWYQNLREHHEEYGLNEDGSWNMNPPWRYQTDEQWEEYDPSRSYWEISGSPYGWHKIDTPEAKKYFQAGQQVALAEAMRTKAQHEQCEAARKKQEEREWMKAHGIDYMPTPLARWRFFDGEMPPDLRRKYDLVENFPYRLLLALAGFVFCAYYVYCDVRGLPPAFDSWYIWSTYLVFFVVVINLFTGFLTNPIKKALLRRLDRKLAAWRKRTASA